MKTLPKFLSAAVLIAAAVAVFAPSPGASSEHFVIVNNNVYGNNAANILQLGGTKADPTLTVVESLDTGGQGLENYDAGFAAPLEAVVPNGSGACLFFADFFTSDIASFVYPGYSKVGNFTAPYPSGMIAHGGHLFVGEYGNAGQVQVFAVNSDCSLTLATQVTGLAGPVLGLAVAPDGKTLIVSEKGAEYYESIVDSFTIGPGPTLTEHGPYDEKNISLGVDITRDSRYALVANYDEDSLGNYILAFPINSDGSLGTPTSFDTTLETEFTGIWFPRLSPNEEFLYVASDTAVLTLDFTESPLNITFGCKNVARMLGGATLATVLPSGAGGGLYVSAYNEDGPSYVGLYSINSSSGCLTADSPYQLPNPSDGVPTVSAWPPRPF